MLLDRTVAELGASRLARQQPEYAIGIAHARDFRIDHDHGAIGKIHGQCSAFLDAGRGVADDEIEAVFAEPAENGIDAFAGQGILVAGLRGGEDKQVVVTLVLDQRLLERAFAVDHVDEVVHHTTFAAHDQVQIAQAHIEIDDGHLLAPLGQSDRQRRAGRGLAYTAFAGGDDDDICQGPISNGWLYCRPAVSRAWPAAVFPPPARLARAGRANPTEDPRIPGTGPQ